MSAPTLFDPASPSAPTAVSGPTVADELADLHAASEVYRRHLLAGEFAEAHALHRATLRPLPKGPGSAHERFGAVRHPNGGDGPEPAVLDARSWADATFFMPAASLAGFMPADVPRS